jgi:anaerobic ribonucleoside-triphosphate reductase activating protein
MGAHAGNAAAQTIRIAGVIRQSIVDGPGMRFVVFTQGCPHHCPGCHNPETHSFSGGYDCETEQILAEIARNPLLKGLTLSGGEPFARPAELLPLVKAVRGRGMDVICYTGYTFEELLATSELDPAVEELMQNIDILKDGRYIHEERDLELKFRGSRNQRLLDMQASLAGKKAVEAGLV